MKYCKRCVYPENAKPTITFDDEGVCSGCRYHESRKKLVVDWDQRWSMLLEIANKAKKDAIIRGNQYDCIIPVSGGKDSHYQVWLAINKLGLNPLLVHFDHAFNTRIGKRNLANLVEKSKCDLVECNYPIESAKKLSRLMLEKVGDLTWHYHSGIKTFPIQVAIERNIPLIIWGEHGFAELTGIVSLQNFVEFTRWSRKEHDMRGIEPESIIGQKSITKEDIVPFIYPDDDAVDACELTGIYLSNFLDWDINTQCNLVMNEWNFQPLDCKRGRTFNLFSKIEDHANEVHDYLKFLKFGYGRATDDASYEIRHGRLTRHQGVALVQEYDAVKPDTLEFYCDLMGISIKEFYSLVDPLRDLSVWSKKGNQWILTSTLHDQKITVSAYSSKEAIDPNNAMSVENSNMYFNKFSKNNTQSNLSEFHQPYE